MSDQAKSDQDKPAASGDLMEAVKAAGKFIGWLSGSLAAITAILYALGYLVTLANLHALGLDFYLFNFNPSFYLVRGSNFTIYLARLLFQSLFFLLLFVAPFAAAFILVRRRWAKNGMPNWASKPIEAGKRNAFVLQGLLFLALAAVLVFDLWPRYENYSDILRISEILFDDDASTGSTDIDQLRPLVAQHDAEALAQLKTVFYKSHLVLIEAAILLFFAWRLTRTWRFRVYLLVPFAFVFVMFLISVPMLYGILIVSNTFPSIRVTTTGDDPASQSNQLYLLSKSDRAFILWDQDQRQVLWLPLGRVTHAEIGQSQPLFSSPSPAMTAQEAPQ